MLGGTMLASAGVLSIVLGISAQKTFGSIIAGIQIALAHPINLDDVVIVENEWGRIEEISFTYVVVRLWDMRRLVVPITYFTETVFQNWTKKSAEIIGSVFWQVDYATPLEPLREELTRLCEESGRLWNGKTCVLQVTDAGAETMTLRAIVSASDASKAWDLRCLVREGMIRYLNEHYPECLPKRRILLQGDGRDREGEA
jgi:small-conductance mechanosensitive channel